MLVDASSIRNDWVFTSDGKKIGSVVNVILLCSSGVPKAWILVFPPEQNWLEDYFRKNYGKLTIDTIKRVFPAEIPKIAEDVKNMGTEKAEEVWNQYTKDNMSKVQMKLKKCYLIPTLAIDGSKRKKTELTLKSDLEHIENKYASIGEPRVSAEKDAAFFATGNVAVRDAESLLPVTLNLNALKDIEVQDCEGNFGCIDDIQLDFDQNAVANLVVQTSGKGAANRLVSAEDFDFPSLTCKKPFASCSELPFI